MDLLENLGVGDGDGEDGLQCQEAGQGHDDDLDPSCALGEANPNEDDQACEDQVKEICTQQMLPLKHDLGRDGKLGLVSQHFFKKLLLTRRDTQEPDREAKAADQGQHPEQAFGAGERRIGGGRRGEHGESLVLRWLDCKP